MPSIAGLLLLCDKTNCHSMTEHYVRVNGSIRQLRSHILQEVPFIIQGQKVPDERQIAKELGTIPILM